MVEAKRVVENEFTRLEAGGLYELMDGDQPTGEFGLCTSESNGPNGQVYIQTFREGPAVPRKGHPSSREWRFIGSIQDLIEDRARLQLRIDALADDVLNIRDGLCKVMERVSLLEDAKKTPPARTAAKKAS